MILNSRPFILKQKNTMQIIFFCFLIIILIACEEEKVLLPIEMMVITDLYAPTTSKTGEPPAGKYVKFSFSKQDTVSDDKWDIAFRATDILVNGGFKGSNDEPVRTGIGSVHIASGTFSGVKEAPADNLFQQDSATGTAIPRGSGKGWYLYDEVTYIFSPIANKILVVKTHDGRYAKMQISSYYKDSPDIPNPFQNQSQTYSFVYTYQPNEGLKNFN